MCPDISYELLSTADVLAEETLQEGLRQLVQAELVYQRGYPPAAEYTFKHALIQDTAYQSLLKRTRQQYHCQLAAVIEQQFAEQMSGQPELLAHHYTAGQLIDKALPYWLQAGQQATQRFANTEAVQYLNQGLGLLQTLLDSPDRARHELLFRLALSAPMIATTGWASPDLGRSMERAHALCQQVGETPELFDVLMGLWTFHTGGQSTLQTAREVAEQALRVAQAQDDATRMQIAHSLMGTTLLFMGDLPTARTYITQGITLGETVEHGVIGQIGLDMKIVLHFLAAFTLWVLGFPEQALQQSTIALPQAQEGAHPYNLAQMLVFAGLLHVLRREAQPTQIHTEAARTLTTEQGFPLFSAWSSLHHGWTVGEQGDPEAGSALLREGLSLYQASGQKAWVLFYLGLSAQLYGQAGQVEEGLAVLAEARELSTQRGDHWSEAELYRLTGELVLNDERKMMNDERKTQEAETHFHKAIGIARQQQAKSWELRAATSLARLWQSQGKTVEAYKLLSDIYNWFTEGFDTADLKDAKSLLDELGEGV